MTAHAWTILVGYMVALLGLAWPLGTFMADVIEGRPTFLSRVLGPLERRCYRLSGVRSDEEMTWRRYAYAVLAFNGMGLLVVYLVQRLQQWLPLNPQRLGAVTSHSAFNTAVSF